MSEQLVSMRTALVEELVQLADEVKVVVLTADLGVITEVVQFKQSFPDRYFDVGVAEQNLLSCAAGMALVGLVPVACTFATYATMRALEQVRSQIAYQRARVVILGYHGGISSGENGATHQSLEDLGIMRAVPGMQVYAPADGLECRSALREAVAASGPCYIRVSRPSWPILDRSAGTASLELGGRRLRAGGALTIACTGVMAHASVAAADALRSRGIEVEVIHCPRLKPFDDRLVAESVRGTGRLLTVEEHLLAGGFGEMLIVRLHARGIAFRSAQVGLDDHFGESGSWADLFVKYGLTAEDISSAAANLMQPTRVAQ